jgi:nicotinate-nucleotide adenylyltransferase
VIGEDATEPSHGAADLTALDLPFIALDMPLTNISATAVRARLGQPLERAGTDAKLVPEAVASYIARHSLYQKTS